MVFLLKGRRKGVRAAMTLYLLLHNLLSINIDLLRFTLL